MKSYYLDANICITYLRGKNSYVREKVNSCPAEFIKIPAIVKAELATGALKSKNPDNETQKIEKFCEAFDIISFDKEKEDIWPYARIRADLESMGMKIGYNDTIIAATVLSRGGVLVTNNVKEFCRVEGLRIEDWTQE